MLTNHKTYSRRFLDKYILLQKKGELFMEKYYEQEKELKTKVPLQKAYEDLTLKDDFIFGKVMQDKELCKTMLSLLTGNEIDNIVSISNQMPVKITGDSKGVRYDVYVEDEENKVYDAEMQRYNDSDSKKELPKRSRYYQGMIDLNLLESGGSYKKLKSSYVIFICTFDPFDRDLCCYTFKNICIEDADVSLEDGRTILFFNTKGKNINVSDEVKEFLDYVETKRTTNNYTRQLDESVDKARMNKEWRVEYMKTLLHDMDVRQEGIEIGIDMGDSKRLISQIVKKIRRGKTVDVIALELEEDEEYISKIYDATIACAPDYDVDTIYRKWKA